MSKTTTQNQIQDYLQWSSQEYQDLLLLSIMEWCQHYGKYPSIVQQLLASSEVNRWFMMEYNKCELQFLRIVDVVPPIPYQLQAHYKACTAQVMIKYPTALMGKIKRNKDFSNLLVTNTPVYYAN
jgi:hypothetical protein